MASVPVARTYDAETAQVFEDLIRESLRPLWVATVVVAWLWLAFAAHTARTHLGGIGLGLVLIVASIWASSRLQARHLGLAVGSYLLGLVLVVTLTSLALHSGAVLYLYMLVVVIGATLTDPRITWAMAVLCVVASLGLGRSQHLPAADVAAPVAFILLAGLASWLSSRRLYTALGWTLSMTREARKNAQQARQHRAEVRRVLKSLDEAYARLERANEALMFAREAADKAYGFKAEFVANVSHELRTPLNLIVGFSQMIATAPESYDGVPLPSGYRGDVMAIYRAARHLTDLINDVLDLSRIEAGRLPMNREAADLGEVIRDAADIVRGLADAKGVRLEMDLAAGLPLVQLDTTRIRQVLLNLLTNATRFTDAGRIVVRAHLEGREVAVTVEDSGRGIPPDRIGRAFEGFSQLDEDRARGGSGLGLAVSKRFVELHGGRMWIESTVGRGTTVGFALPLSGPHTEAPDRPKVAAPQASQAQPLVLVLHDDEHALTTLRRYLEGYRFALADNVEKAAEALVVEAPAAVIMDASWAERWPAFAAALDIPQQTAVVTCPLPSLRRLGLLLGATDMLIKPVAREDLAAAVARLARPPQTALVVDDNPHVARLLARMLKSLDRSPEVWEAFGGREGLEIARIRRPDVVFLDLAMPDLDGYQFLEQRQRDARLADTQVVIVSVQPAEVEAAPFDGELRLRRSTGLSLSEVLNVLQAMLSVVRTPAGAPPARGAERREVPPGQLAW